MLALELLCEVSVIRFETFLELYIIQTLVLNKLKTQITKSWRKSISMSFDKNGVLQIKAPKFMLPGQIESFIQKNNAWIEKHYAKIGERSENKKYYLFGEEINPPVSDHNPVPLNKGEDETQWSREIEKFYKSEAKRYIVPRCNELAEKYGFTHT